MFSSVATNFGLKTINRFCHDSSQIISGSGCLGATRRRKRQDYEGVRLAYLPVLYCIISLLPVKSQNFVVLALA